MPFSLIHFKNKFWKLNSIHWLRTEHIKAWLNAIIHLVLPFFSATTLNKAALRLTSHSALKSFCSMRSSSLLSLVTMVAWRGVLSRMDSPKAVPIPRVQMVTASWEPQKPVVRKVDILSADEFFSQKWTVDPWTMWELGVPTPSRSRKLGVYHGSYTSTDSTSHTLSFTVVFTTEKTLLWVDPHSTNSSCSKVNSFLYSKTFGSIAQFNKLWQIYTPCSHHPNQDRTFLSPLWLPSCPFQVKTILSEAIDLLISITIKEFCQF